MINSAAAKWAFAPGLLRVIRPTELDRLHSRLRDRVGLESLRKQADADRRELEASAAWLAEHSGRPAPDDLDADTLTQYAGEAQEKEREAAAHFVPVIAALKNELRPPGDEFEADVQQFLRDGIEVLEGGLAFYHGLYIMLARQAVERRGPGKVMRARPVEEPIDYAELSREHIALYPKIRARLAE